MKSYIKHAEKFGVEGVFETAVRAGLTVEQLARLYSQLRSIDRQRQEIERASNVRHYIEPVWDVPRRVKSALVAGLVGLGWSNRRVRQTIGVGQSTITTTRRETVELAAPRAWHADGGVEDYAE
jgi:hypothetical protein